jgi:hypothetical protein
MWVGVGNSVHPSPVRTHRTALLTLCSVSTVINTAIMSLARQGLSP